MALSTLACLFAKNFDYLRAHLFDVELGRLLGQLGVFGVMFLPYFAGYGLSEYLGYQVGKQALGGKVRVVYAVYLFGAAAAYLFSKLLLPSLGMARLLVIAVLGVTAAILVLSRSGSRRGVGVQACILFSLLFIPSIEPLFLSVFKGKGPESTWDYRVNMRCRPVFQSWGRYGLVEIMATPDRSEFHGFYNDMYQWSHSPSYGFRHRSLGVVPIMEMPKDAKIAIIGAGGGRQVRLAQRRACGRIVAIEIESAVFEAVRDPMKLQSDFAGVYEAPEVARALRRGAHVLRTLE